MMHRFIIGLSGMVAVLSGGLAVRAETINIRAAPYSAVGDGTSDNRPALERVFSQAKPGDQIIVPPGNYRVVLSDKALEIPSGVTLSGQVDRSRFILDAEAEAPGHCEFLQPGSDVTVEGITIERKADFSSVLLPLSGEVSRVTFRDCRIMGGQARFPKTYCHAFRVGLGKVTNLTLEGVTIEDCTYGLFQPNNATGTTEDVTVEHCQFARNTASDLEFNSPNGVMRRIVVRNCIFRDNLSKTASGGFAVGFAHVTDGRVEGCVIQNYGSEALHVEDRSADIQLVRNVIVGGSLRQPNGVILVLSHSTGVVIERNSIDARKNQNRPQLILVTAGGRNQTRPSEVSIQGNVLLNGSATHSFYLQPGSGPMPLANVSIPTGQASRTSGAPR